MRKIYSTQDRIKVRIGDLTVFYRPLSYAEKSEIQAEMLKGDIKSAMDGAYNALKAALVDVQGLHNPDGSAFKYEPEKLDDILNLPEAPTLTKAALNLLSNVPQTFKDPETNSVLHDVEIVRDEEEETPEKK